MISVIIPVFNTEEYLEETLRSIQFQSYSDWECICVDDGSTDRSMEILYGFEREDKRIRVFRRPDHLVKGGSSCRNFGFELSKGEYIHFFDSDDIMDRYCLEKKINRLTSAGNIDFVVGYTGAFSNRYDPEKDYSDTVYYKNLFPVAASILEDYATIKTVFYTPGPLFKRHFLERIKAFRLRESNSCSLFDETLGIFQDYDFYIHALLLNPRYEVINEPLVLYRYRETSLSAELDKLDTRKVNEGLRVLIKINQFLSEQGRCSKAMDYFLINECLSYVRKLMKKKNYKDGLEKLRTAKRLAKLKGISPNWYRFYIALTIYLFTNKGERFLQIK